MAARERARAVIFRAQRPLESTSELINGGRARRVRAADAENVDSLCPMVLVVEIRDDYLRGADEGGRSGRSRAAVRMIADIVSPDDDSNDDSDDDQDDDEGN